MSRNQLNAAIHQRVVCILCVCMGVLLASCVAVRPTRPVRLGYLPMYAYLPIFVANENGYFKAEGLDIDMIRFESSTNLATALVNNDIDFAGNLAYPSALSIESRDPGRFKIYLASAHTPAAYLSSLVTMPSSGIKTVEDLKGKTVGMYPGPSSVVFFRLLFKKHGLNPDSDLTLIEMAENLEIGALTSGKVDALATFEPIATQAVVDYGAVKFLPAAIESEVVQPWHGGVSVIPTNYLNEQPDTAKRLISAVYKAVDFIRANPQEAKRSLTAYTGISAKVAEATPSPPFIKPTEFVLNEFQDQAEILIEEGVLSQYIDVSKLLLSPDFLPPNE